MKKFEEKKFNIPELKGISKKTIEEHLKLYSGYVKNANLIFEKIGELIQAPEGVEKNAYAIAELQRRFGFEFDGMRNHEVYFSLLEGGSKPLPAASSALRAMIEAEGGTFEGWLVYFKMIAMTRGVGWAMLYYDRASKRLLTTWVDEQHVGQLQDCALVMGIDMWEHSFVADYQPSGKKQYVEDFVANVNWEVVERNFVKATK
jgi:Fe-Mn family superoxide dismutase